MRVLLTGAQHFLGRLVAARLRKRSVVALILTVPLEIDQSQNSTNSTRLE